MVDIGSEVSGASETAAEFRKLAAEMEESAHYKVGSNLEYSRYQELGTSFHAPQPYLRPALNTVEGEIDAIMEGAEDPQEGIAQVALRVRDEAREFAPVDTGRLRDSIKRRRMD